MKYDTEQMTFIGTAGTAEESAALALHYEIMAAAHMPLAVKGIVLENTLLRVKVQLKEEEAAQAQAAALAPEPADTMEATEAPAEQATEEGADNG